MSGSDPVWSDERIARLRALWAEELPTAEIGRRLGMTKNAVVGKAHRLGLPGRPSPIRPGKPPSWSSHHPIKGPTLAPAASAAPVTLRAGRPTTQPAESLLKAQMRAWAGLQARREKAARDDAPKAPAAVRTKPVPPKRCCWPMWGRTDVDGLPLLSGYQADPRPGRRPLYCNAPLAPVSLDDGAFPRLSRPYCPLHLCASNTGGPALIRAAREPRIEEDEAA